MMLILAAKFLEEISIHAPTRGATDAGKLPGRRDADFNPRSHEGSDGSESPYTDDPSNFNPRSHEGSDYN